MKKIFIVVALLSLLSSYADSKTPITILKIIDGDTLEVHTNNKNKFSLRLFEIDCYETSQSHRAKSQAYDDKINLADVIDKGLNAKKYLRKIKNNAKEISFEFKGIDKYGRVLGVLYLDNININQKLIDEKYCKIYKYKEWYN